MAVVNNYAVKLLFGIKELQVCMRATFFCLPVYKAHSAVNDVIKNCPWCISKQNGINMATIKIPEQKVILCGEYGVGKSSLFRRFATNTFVTATDRQSTLGLDHVDKVYRVGTKDIKLQLWDTGGMERVASITSSYYKFAEAAILVFSLDNPSSFHSLSQHLLEIVTYAENAKIFLCGNKLDLLSDVPQVTEADIEAFCEQCHNLINNTYKTSCKTGEGIEEMFQDIAYQLVQSNRSRLELQTMESHGFKITQAEEPNEEQCLC